MKTWKKINSGHYRYEDTRYEVVGGDGSKWAILSDGKSIPNERLKEVDEKSGLFESRAYAGFVIEALIEREEIDRETKTFETYISEKAAIEFVYQMNEIGFDDHFGLTIEQSDLEELAETVRVAGDVHAFSKGAIFARDLSFALRKNPETVHRSALLNSVRAALASSANLL